MQESSPEDAPGIGTSVVITTYNDDHRLALTLQGFYYQQNPLLPYEVIIVNDGGDDGLEDRIMGKVFLTGLNMPARVQFLYLDPPSADFRLAAARNLGISVTDPSSEQLIICDCDTVPASDFIRRHQEAYSIDVVNVGLRKRIRIQDVEQLDYSDIITDGYLEQLAYCADERVTQRREYFRIHEISNPWCVSWGCNISFPIQIVKKIGGFDEEFIGWGGEDEDLARRLYQCGLRFNALSKSTVYHLDHFRRTTQVASQTFHKKMNHGVVRNGGPIQTRKAG